MERASLVRPFSVRPPRRYGDDAAQKGEARWALWSMERGEPLPERFRTWAEAEAARGGCPDKVPCLQYDWGGGD